MQLTPEMIQALATAARQWHEAQRRYEADAKAFADSQTQLQLAERDLHELARALDVVAGVAVPAGVAAVPVIPVATSAPTPIGGVTMPIVPAAVAVGTAPPDGLDAGAEVLRIMQAERGQYAP
jgi:hypothetical protein